MQLVEKPTQVTNGEEAPKESLDKVEHILGKIARTLFFKNTSLLFICVLLFCGIEYINYERVTALQGANNELLIKVRNQDIFLSDKDKFLRLEELLRLSPEFGKRLDGTTAPIAKKVLELSAAHGKEGLTAALLLGIMEAESSFTPSIISVAADGKTPIAYGLMQVVRSTAEQYLTKLGYEWSPQIMLDPEVNIQVGAMHLLHLHRIYMSSGLETINDFTFSIVSYNKGSRPVLEAMSKTGKNTVSLNYVANVRIYSKKWVASGF